MSLVARTALAVGAVGSLILAAVGSGAYLVVRDRTVEAESVKLEVRSQAVVARVESRLRQAVESVDALARNLVIGNALLDGAGREIYVRPLLNGVAQIEGQVVGLALLDFRGRVLLTAGPALEAAPPMQAWLRERIESGTPGARSVRSSATDDLDFIVIAYPVLLPNTRSGEGALAMRVPAHALLAGFGGPGESYRLDFPTAEAPRAHAGVALALQSLPVIDRLGLHLHAQLDRSAADQALARLQWQFLAFSVVAVLAMVLLSVFAARRVTLPIRSLAAMAQRIAGPGGTEAQAALVMPASAPGEVGMLAESLLRMLDRLDQAARAQRDSLETQLRAIFEGMVDGAVTADENGNIVSVNPAVTRLLGHDSAALLGRPIGLLIASAPAEGRLAPRPQATAPIELAARHRDGHTLPVEWSSDEFRSDGRRMFIVMLRDISERQRADRQIRSALREKDVLLKEIYHRVKNNLQVVSSLLSLQGRGCSDDAARALLQDSANRVKSMALVHEQLYQAGDLSQIDFTSYLEQLAGHLRDAHGEAARRVPIRIEAERVSLGIETAVPLGLMINELVSNSYKHAYPDGRSGELWLRVKTLPDGALRVAVSDDGIGLPAGFRPEAGRSLGMQLVVSLAEQLGGRLGYDAPVGGGTHFTLDIQPEQPEIGRLAP